MIPGKIQKTIDEIISIVLDELDDYGFRHHCIEASALLTRVLHGAGMPKAYPLTVGVRLINEAFRRYVDAHGMPHDEAGGKACYDAGGPTIILGKDAPEVPEENWTGHLVVIVPDAFGEKHALLDPTITQANWPEFGIVLPSLCLKVTEDFVLGGRPANFEINKTLLIYSAYPDDRSYNDHGDCMKKEGLDEAASIVLRRTQG